MVRKKLVTRVEDPDDRRVKRLALTAKGQRLADRIISARLASLEEFTGSLEADERRKLESALDALMKRPEVAEIYANLREEGEPMTRYRHLVTDDNRKWWTLGAMCFALFMVMLDNTVVNVALPSIQREIARPALGAGVGHQRLHPDLRGADRHGRAPGRHLRTPADVPLRA